MRKGKEPKKTPGKGKAPKKRAQKPGKKSTKKITKVSDKKKVTNGADTPRPFRNNFENFNIVRAEIVRQLKEKGTVYSRKELNGYTRAVLGDLKSKYTSKAELNKAIKYALEDVVSTTFTSTPNYEFRPDYINWWELGGEVAELNASTHIIVDNREVIGEDTDGGVENVDADGVIVYAGKQYSLDKHLAGQAAEINKVLLRKDYAYYIEVFYRSEEKQKEFFYYLLLAKDEDGELHSQLSNVEDQNWEALQQYIQTHKILDIDAIYDTLDVVKKENTAKVIKPREIEMPRNIITEKPTAKKDKEKEPEKLEATTKEAAAADRAFELKKLELEIEKEKSKQGLFGAIKDIREMVKDGILTKAQAAEMLKKLT